MGSEHYCLRWNNHQSNLLGVFSQLLESESLVDVTLACTEGPSIRAHKVVLSACSSYFQALFLDHPNRHPIVILKDVRFAELRTLVDFMYKGEVNVEYCQLSALLKTAESLKVKGLADMTNINAAAVQASRDEQSQSQSQSQTSSSQQQQSSSSSTSTTSVTTTTTTAAAAAAAAATAAMTTSSSSTTAAAAPDRSEPMAQDAQDERPQLLRDSREREARNCSERDRDCRDRDRDRDRDREKERDKRDASSRDSELQMPAASATSATTTTTLLLQSQQNSECAIDDDDDDDVEISECPASPTTTRGNNQLQPQPRPPSSPCPGPLALDRPRSRRDSDSPASVEETRGSLSPLSVHSGPSDMSLSNNNNGAAGTGGGVTPVTVPIGSLPQSRLPSPHSTEPLAGPSGLPPVQQVPLSLKKEVDWERSTEERSASSEMSSDYRLPPDPVSLALGLESSSWAAGLAPGDLVAAAAASGAESSAALLSSAGFAAGLAGLARRCGVCLASFPSSWLLERHALLQHAGLPGDDKPFTCEQCGQRYRYRSAYVKHREQNHRARLPADKLFTCEVCGMQFRYLKSFKKHRLNHALERLQRAPSNESQALTERSDQVSSTGEPSQLESGSAGDASPLHVDSEADRGGRDTPSESGGREEAANSETASIQENASEATETTTLLRESSEGPLDATRGALTAASSEPEDEDGRPESGAAGRAGTARGPNIGTSLNLTVSRSSGRPAHHHHHEPDRRERRFACPFCGKCVRSKENLKLHVRKHTGERPFVCLFCGRAFGGKSDLTRHLRIHTGERPYHCEMCGKCFARADYLSKHLTTHIHQR